jgi:hypothetical protein
VLFGADWLANLYLGCFLFGLIFTTFSLLLGSIRFGGHIRGPHLGKGFLHHAGHGAHGPHLPHAAGHGISHRIGGLRGGGHGGAQVGGLRGAGHHSPPVGGHHPISLSEQIDPIGPLNMSTLLAGLTWFGGAGYIFRTNFGMAGPFSAVLAVASGLAGGGLIFLIISRVLWPGQTQPMRRADYYLPGTPARVTSGITEGGTGEIVFQKAGNRRVEGARSETGVPIPRGTEVTIVRYEKGLAYVAPVSTVADIPPPAEHARLASGTDAVTMPLRPGDAQFIENRLDPQ